MTAENAPVEPLLLLDLDCCDSGVGVLGLELSVSIKERRLVAEGSIDGAVLAD